MKKRNVRRKARGKTNPTNELALISLIGLGITVLGNMDKVDRIANILN